MPSSTNVDYVNNFFEHPELTRIAGRPSYQTLTVMRRELKANACSVYSNLGGGAHGHLFLVTTPQQFAMVSNVPFVRPNHPGPLVIPHGTNQAMAGILRDQHAEAQRQFQEVQGVERALLKQIVVAAIDKTYLTEFRNHITGQINGPVRHLLGQLF